MPYCYRCGKPKYCVTHEISCPGNPNYERYERELEQKRRKFEERYERELEHRERKFVEYNENDFSRKKTRYNSYFMWN